jgi:stage II sporulation protein D
VNTYQVSSKTTWRVTLLATFLLLFTATHAQSPAVDLASQGAVIENIGAERLLIRLRDGLRTATLRADAPFTVKAGPYESTLPAGEWTVRLTDSTPATFRHRVIVKGLNPPEFGDADEHLREWAGKGYKPEPLMLGHRLRLKSGGTIDARVLWITLAVLDSDEAAQALRKKLEKEGTWAWQRAELVKEGSGNAALSSKKLDKVYALTFPAAISSAKPITLTKQGDYEARAYPGELVLGVGGDGAMTVTERIGIDDYLAGVLPSEMPALWPADALKAQAVAARSDVLAHMRVKHYLAGYHFSDTVQDRAYNGAGGHHPNADAAVAATHGQVITDGARLLPGVFSATCGGWTEENDTVWYGPADLALRGTSDLKAGGESPTNIRKWLNSSPPAYCGHDEKYYRWTRRFTRSELTRLVGKHHNIGTVRSVELGSRGPSGRLDWVKVTGSNGAALVKKELPIRQLFGSLPSAMFIIDENTGADGQPVFVFSGGGRGHGVGMCQYGARGRADAGQSYREILRHYFGGAQVAEVN